MKKFLATLKFIGIINLLMMASIFGAVLVMSQFFPVFYKAYGGSVVTGILLIWILALFFYFNFHESPKVGGEEKR